jgi:hypothetical protein
MALALQQNVDDDVEGPDDSSTEPRALKPGAGERFSLESYGRVSVTLVDAEYMDPFDAQWIRIGEQASLRHRWRRRLGLRTPISVPVAVSVQGRALHCSMTELSPTGFVVETPLALRPDQIVFLCFAIPWTGERLYLRARSVRATESANALEFVDTSDADRLTLAEVIDYLRA